MMLGVQFQNSEVGDDKTFVIGTYDIISGTLIYYYPSEVLVAYIIWICGEYIQFATLGVQSITIWENKFTSKHSPTEVQSLPTPDNFDPWEDLSSSPSTPCLPLESKKLSLCGIHAILNSSWTLPMLKGVGR